MRRTPRARSDVKRKVRLRPALVGWVGHLVGQGGTNVRARMVRWVVQYTSVDWMCGYRTD